MPITFACECGKQLKVGDDFAGKRARCPACAAVLAVPSGDSFPAAPPPLPATSEDDAYKLLDDGPPAPAARRTDRDADDSGRPSASAPPAFRRRDSDAPPRPKYRQVSDAEPDPESRGPAYSPHWLTVFGGLFSLALGGPFCWLRNGGVSIVGIVLLALGFFSVGKGLLGYQDD